jgi:RNA polymerase sigma factor (sigma-70 family)
VKEATLPAARDELPELLEELRPKVRRILRWFKIPPQDAEDLVQITLLLALAKWPEIETPAAWVLATLQYRCIIYWRERRLAKERLVQLEPEMVEQLPQAACPPAQERREQRIDLGELARGLSERYRRVLVLRYQLGMRDSEVAEVTGLSPSSVQHTSQRAVAQLRRARDLRTATAARWSSALAAAAAGGMVPWEVAVEAFVVGGAGAAAARHLARAGEALGRRPLGELQAADLAWYRAGARAESAALKTLRSFLLWTGERGAHRLAPAVIAAALNERPRRRGGARRRCHDWRLCGNLFNE